MECPRDTDKNVVGEVHLMETGNENEFLVDANGLDIPQGEISVYKDSSGELVLVVHAEDTASKSSGGQEEPSASSEQEVNKAAAMESEEASSCSGNIQSKSIDECIEAAEAQATVADKPSDDRPVEVSPEQIQREDEAHEVAETEEPKEVESGEVMEVEEVSHNVTLGEDPERSSEADVAVEPVSETVEITVSNEEELFVVIQDRSNEDEGVAESAATNSTTASVHIGGPPKKKRGRPSKKHANSNGSTNDSESHEERRRRASIGDEPPRRSVRERHTRRYADFMDDNWDDDDGEEGDGLTAQERRDLDRRLQGQLNGGRMGRGASRNAANWVKKCNIMVGETASLDRSQLRTRKVEPVRQIIQPPPRPSQAIIRRYLEPEPIVEEAVTHCRIMCRPQDTFGIDMAQKRKRGMQDDYTCSKCQYWTCRIDNYVRHLRDLCAFNKDFFAWDEGTLKEVTRNQKATNSASDSSKATDNVKIAPIVLGYSSESGNNAGDTHSHSHSREVKDTTKGGAGDSKVAVDRKEGPGTVGGRARAKWGAGGDGADDEIGDATEREVSARLGFKKHDIVWADLGKGVHWPALVLNIRNRGLQGKARVNTMQVKVYLVHDGEVRTLPLAKVDGFDSPRRQSYLEIAKGGRGALAVDHARAAQKADKFLRERVLGTNIDPIRFFCLGETKAVDDHQGSSTSSDEEEAGGDEAAKEGAEARPQWSLPEIEPLPVIVADPQKSAGGTDCEIDAVKALHIVKKAKRRRKMNNMALVDFIINGKVESHLVGIYRGTVPSERHASYMSSDEGRRAALKKSASWGPVDDVGQQEAVFEYCEDLFQRSVGDSGDSSGTEHGAGQVDKHTYAFEVFCPEAITKAISRLAFVDMETAARIFLQGHEQSRQFTDVQDQATKAQELEKAAQKSKDEALERERQSAAAPAAAPEEASAPTEAPAKDQEAMETEEAADDAANKQLNTGDVVREELERLGVDQKLLEVLDKTE